MSYLLLLKKKNSSLYFLLKKIYQGFFYKFKLSKTVPSYLKHEIIEKYLIPNSIFIETGTYYGETVKKFIDNPNFFKIYSIEASKLLYNLTKKMKSNKVNLYYGTTEKILPQILIKLRKLNAKYTFFLDAHYSYNETFRGKEDFPIITELRTINKYVKTKKIILIDDFDCLPIYVTNFIKKNYVFKVVHNIIIIKN
jgi:hypothetical protein